MDTRVDRAQFSRLASENKYASILFLMYDERPYEHAIWKLLRPAHEKPFSERSEDVS